MANDITNQIMEILETKGALSKSTIPDIKKSSLIKFTNAIVDAYMNSSFFLLDRYYQGLKDISLAIDDMKDDSEQFAKEFDYYYNFITLSFLVDYISFYKKEKEHSTAMSQFFFSVLKDERHINIFKNLLDNKFLSQKQLATKSNMTPQNLSNYLSKIKNLGVINTVMMPANHKTKFYFLSFDFKKFLQENKYEFESIVSRGEMMKNPEAKFQRKAYEMENEREDWLPRKSGGNDLFSDKKHKSASLSYYQ